MTETKVKAGALAALIVGVIGQGILGVYATDFVPALPDVFEVPAYSLIASAAVWVAGWTRRSTAGRLAPSTIEAVGSELRKRTP